MNSLQRGGRFRFFTVVVHTGSGVHIVRSERRLADDANFVGDDRLTTTKTSENEFNLDHQSIERYFCSRKKTSLIDRRISAEQARFIVLPPGCVTSHAPLASPASLYTACGGGGCLALAVLSLPTPIFCGVYFFSSHLSLHSPDNVVDTYMRFRLEQQC